jgi:hypothetical protein
MRFWRGSSINPDSALLAGTTPADSRRKKMLRHDMEHRRLFRAETQCIFRRALSPAHCKRSAYQIDSWLVNFAFSNATFMMP